MNGYIFEVLFNDVGSAPTRRTKIINWRDSNKAEIIKVKMNAELDIFNLIDAFKNEKDSILESGKSTILISKIPVMTPEEAVYLYDAISLYISHHIDAYFIDRDKVFNKPNDSEMMMIIMSAVNDNKTKLKKSIKALEVNKLKIERIKAGKTVMLTTPAWIFFNEETEKYELNDKCDTVRTVFEMYLKGLSYASLSKYMNDCGIPTLGKASEWGQTSIKWVLSKPEAKGTLVFSGESFDDFYPKVVTEAEFLKVKMEMERRSNYASFTGKNKTPTFLSGLVKCDNCNKSINVTGKFKTLQSGSISDQRYLVCESTKKNDPCGIRPFRYKDIEALILHVISLVELDINNTEERKKDDISNEIKAKKSEIDRLSISIESLTDILLDVESEHIKAKIKECEINKFAKRAELDKLLLELESESATYSPVSCVDRMKKLALSLADNDAIIELKDYLTRSGSEIRLTKNRAVYGKIAGVNFSITGTKGRVEVNAGCKHSILTLHR